MLDYSYSELEESDITNVFEDAEACQYKTTDNEATYFYAECEDEPDMFMNHLKVAVYEVQHDILSDDMKADFLQYAERWDKGEFQPDLIPGDIPLIQHDIDFVRAALEETA